MKIKKILFYIVILIAVISVSFLVYEISTSGSKSPEDKTVYTDGDFELSVVYSRPYKKDRLIFGPEEEDALVPFDTYWRTGANEATEIEFNRDVSVEGEDLNAGRYRLYTIPGKEYWVIVFNNDLDRWGYYEPDYSKDVLRTEVTSYISDNFHEQFTIYAEKQTDSSLILKFNWDQTEVPVRIDY